MSDNEVEKFEVTDYDLQNEFNLNRPRHRLTKNQQIYGIWADDSGEEENESTSRRAQFQGVSKKKQSYTTPVSFVAGGIQQSGKKKNEEKEGKKEGASPMDEDEGENETFQGGSSSEEEIPRAGFGQTKQKKAPAFGKRRPLAQSHAIGEIDADIAGMRRKTPGASSMSLMQKGVGNWERHTKGIGAKLLLQMGFQPGKGLGRNLQGISAPVEAAVRKGRGAIGAYGPERGQKIADQKDSEDEEAKEFSEKLSQWRKGDSKAGQKKQKVRYAYKTVDQVLEEGKGKPAPSIKDYSKLTKVKVIDMTGPEQRVLSGYHAIAGQQRPSDEWDSRKDRDFSHFDMPELLHNLDLLVTMCEQEIVDSGRKIRIGQDRKVVLEQEMESLGTLVENQAIQIDSIESILVMMESLNEKPLTLTKASQCIRELQTKHSTEYHIYEIGAMAGKLVTPLFQEQLKEWRPLESPAEPQVLAEFQLWKRLLEGERSHTLSAAAARDPYHTLIWEAWMPSIRTAIGSWNCRQSGPIISLLEAWRGIIPGWILGSVVDQLVLPRLGREVELWDPLTDTVPVHEWLHPWIPFAKDTLIITIYPVIRRKLSTALTAWHPSDRSAHLMLKPWQKAFPKGDMDAFLVSYILPKLQAAMQELVINPHQQHLDQWNWVMEWEDMLPVYTMATLLENFFFPKWIQVLTMWLTHAPNYDEIGKWYKGWKSMISETLLLQPGVKAKLNEALQLMNRAAIAASQNQSMSFLVNPVPPPPPPPAARRETPQELMAEAVRTASQIPQGFRELLQKRCEERGILFVPMPNRWHEGKQVYKCGKVQVYLDRNVIFVCRMNTNIWTPSNLHAVLEMAT